MVPVALDGLVDGLGETLAFNSSIARLTPLTTSSKASWCVGGRAEVVEDILLPFDPWKDITIKPVMDHVLVSQVAEVCCQFVAQFPISVSIGNEHIDRHSVLLIEWNSFAVIIIPICYHTLTLPIDDSNARQEWGWAPRHDQERIIDDFLRELKLHPQRYG